MSDGILKVGESHLTDSLYTRLKEQERIITESVKAIAENFFRIGQALLTIKKEKLYKADPLYNTWSEYVRKRIGSKLHLATIQDYISIVQMQLELKEYMTPQQLMQLGYKKAKYLKSKYNIIKRLKDPVQKELMLKRFVDVYKDMFDDLKDLNFTAFKYQFDFIPANSRGVKKGNITSRRVIGNAEVTFNPIKGEIIIKALNNSFEELSRYHNIILNALESSEIN